ncbi:MAG: hypothetical protein M5R40_13135 [Anaerolineae bacterium]|nr:hypothetical protein [Anaerolineae bacterium]
MRIFWAWIVTEPQYMEQQLEYATYDVRLDGAPLENYSDFQGPLRWYPDEERLGGVLARAGRLFAAGRAPRDVFADLGAGGR